MLSEVGENSIVSKDQDTTPNQPFSMTDQLRVCSESTEASREQGKELVVTSGQTIPHEWLVARAQRKGTVKPPINLEDLFY